MHGDRRPLPRQVDTLDGAVGAEAFGEFPTVDGPRDGEELQVRTVRYRTVGDMSCTGAVDSDASTIDEVLVEIANSTLTERGATRADDRLSESAMEDRKKEGYF